MHFNYKLLHSTDHQEYNHTTALVSSQTTTRFSGGKLLRTSEASSRESREAHQPIFYLLHIAYIKITTFVTQAISTNMQINYS